MDLDQAIEELYGVAPEDFVARRTALVAQARASRDRELAKQIGALRRPTKTAWLVNLLAREAAEDVAELLAIAEALRTAQVERAGADVRRLSTERRRVVETLVRRAGELAAGYGRPAGDATLQEVALTLQAGLADEESAALVRAGRLTGAMSVGGFGGWDLSGGPTAAAGDGPIIGTAEAMAATPATAGEDPAAQKARQEQERRAAEAARLAAETTAAEQALAAAQAAAELAAVRVETLRTELAAAETAAAAAARELDAAMRRLVDLGAPAGRG